MNKLFSEISSFIADQSGRPWVFVLAVATIVVWAITDPIFGFSDTWQTDHQYRHTHRHFPDGVRHSEHPKPEGAALQVKLDELIRVSEGQNRFIVSSI